MNKISKYIAIASLSVAVTVSAPQTTNSTAIAKVLLKFNKRNKLQCRLHKSESWKSEYYGSFLVPKFS